MSNMWERVLGLALRTAKESGNYRIDYIEVKDYPLRCNKCPECSMKCFEKSYNKAKETDDSPIDIGSISWDIHSTAFCDIDGVIQENSGLTCVMPT